MSTEVTKPRSFRESVTIDALAILTGMYGPERAKIAAGRIALAFDVAVRTAKDPKALLDCTLASIRACIANSASTQLYPGGPSPDVYLVPRKGVLGWSLTHVGMAKLAARQGYALIVVPVHNDDKIKLEFGEAVLHEQDPRRSPQVFDDLCGVVVVLRRIEDSRVVGRPFVGVDVLNARRKARGAGPVWNEWPIEMAMGKAVKYAYARGMLPLTGEDWQAAMMADDTEIIDVESEPATQAAPKSARTKLKLEAATTIVPDFEQESARLNERETITVEHAPTDDDAFGGDQ